MTTLQQTKSTFIYTTLCTIFSILVITCNMVYQKFIILDVYFYTFEISAGAILYPLTFLVTDLIAECFGKQGSIFCIRLGLSMNITVAIFIFIFEQLPATSWSKVDNQMFSIVFAHYLPALFSSLVACYTSQRLDIFLYLWLKKLTGTKWLALRNFISSALGLLIDTCIVICLLALFNILPYDKMKTLIASSYMFKLFCTILNIALFKMSVIIVKKALQ